MFATDAPRATRARVLTLGGPAVAAAALPRAGTVMGFDFGAARIGVAVGDLELRIPHALQVIPSAPRTERYRAVGTLVDEWLPVLIAVGVPFPEDRDPHAFAPRCERFARSLEGRLRLPVVLVDESFSSHAASDALTRVGVRGRGQKPHLDAAAAAEILAVLFSEIDAAA